MIPNYRPSDSERYNDEADSLEGKLAAAMPLVHWTVTRFGDVERTGKSIYSLWPVGKVDINGTRCAIEFPVERRILYGLDRSTQLEHLATDAAYSLARLLLGAGESPTDKVKLTPTP